MDSSFYFTKVLIYVLYCITFVKMAVEEICLSSPVIIVVITFGLLWILYPAWLVLTVDSIDWTVEQLSIKSSSSVVSKTDNSKFSKPPILSLIIPAYNEQDRISIMIRECFEYLTSKRGEKLIQKLHLCAQMMSSDDSNLQKEHCKAVVSRPEIEWLIVNDGSCDSTCDIVRETHTSLLSNSLSDYSLESKWKIVSLKQNSGKGAAVKTGMHLAEGVFHLMVDADGATDFGNGIENLTRELHVMMERNSSMEGDRSLIAVFGSRAHLEKTSAVKRTVVRTILMKAFHFFVSLFVSAKVKDTQCGFKLFTKPASNFVSNNLHLRRWAFDTEIIILCDKQSIDILEVNVPWHEVDGSKLSTSKLALALVSMSMLRDMICVWACYTFGIWKVRSIGSRFKN